jgi:hypothetical protein
MASAVPSPARPHVSALSGIFSDVFEHPETADLLGLEIEIHADAAAPYALVVYCEGGCSSYHRVPIKLDGRHFSLSFSERLRDSSGRPDGTDRYRIAGGLVGGALVGELQLNSYREQFRLEHRRKRFGLAVARTPAK